jgi:hypothetical protein
MAVFVGHPISLPEAQKSCFFHHFHVQFHNFLAVSGIVNVDQLCAVHINIDDAINQRQDMAQNRLNNGL